MDVCPLCGAGLEKDFPLHLRSGECPRSVESETSDILEKKETADVLGTDIPTAVEVENRLDKIEEEVQRSR